MALATTSVFSRANFLLQCANRQPHLLRDEGLRSTLSLPPSTQAEESGVKWKSIHDQLVDLFLELRDAAEAAADEDDGRIRHPPGNLLGILVEREKLNTLVLKLYPGNEGYALLLKGQNGNPDSETIRLPYEEEDFLNFVDNEQLPPVVGELLQQCQENYFYSGCVILEVKDFRRLPPDAVPAEGCAWDDLPHVLDFILLRPNNLNLVGGINGYIAASGPGDPNSRWTQEERDSLESQLLLATSDPLCLNPDPSVGVVLNKLYFERQKLNRSSTRKSARRDGLVARNRRKFFSTLPAPRELSLHEFLRRREGGRRKTVPSVSLRISKSLAVDSWRRRNHKLDPPKSSVKSLVDKVAKALPFEISSTNALPVTVEEFILETERQTGKVNYTRVVIQQRPTDHLYIGELYVDKDFEDGKLKGSSCKFPLGTKTAVEKYIQQFTEIVTEEGRRPVKITHVVPGQAAKICSTQGLTISNSTPKTPRRISSSSSSSLPQTSPSQTFGAAQSNAADGGGGGGGVQGMMSPGLAAAASAFSALQSKKSVNAPSTSQLKINLSAGMIPTTNVQLVNAGNSANSAPTGTSIATILPDGNASHYSIISSDEESTSGANVVASGVNQSINQNLTNLQTIPAGTQLQFQQLSQVTQQQQTQQQHAISLHHQIGGGFGGLKQNIGRTNNASLSLTRQSTGTVSQSPTPSNSANAVNSNIFQNLSQLQQQQQQQQHSSHSVTTNILQRNALQQQQQQQQTFNRRSSGGLIRAAGPQLRIHQQSSDVASSSGGGGGLIQIHPNQATSGGPNIIQIHQGQILNTANAGGLIQSNQDLTRTISPGAATIIPNASSSSINLANLQKIQIQRGAGNINLNALSAQGSGVSNISLGSLPTQLQMQIGGVGGGAGITVPVSLAAALTQSVAANSSGANVGGGIQQSSSVPASIALALGSLAQPQSGGTVSSSTPKFLTTGGSGQVFVTSNAVQQSGAALQQPTQQPHQNQASQQQQQLVMAAAGPFLQINASGATASMKGTVNASSAQIRGNQIPMLQTMGIHQQPQQQNILLTSQPLQQQQLQQQQHLEQRSASGVQRFRII